MLRVSTEGWALRSALFIFESEMTFGNRQALVQEEECYAAAQLQAKEVALDFQRAEGRQVSVLSDAIDFRDISFLTCRCPPTSQAPIHPQCPDLPTTHSTTLHLSDLAAAAAAASPPMLPPNLAKEAGLQKLLCTGI